jgi:hypothetical protein
MDRGRGFATLTHARLRAAQGDVAGASRILRVILDAQPDHVEARDFLASLDGRIPVTYRETAEPPLQDAKPAVAAELTGAFRSAIGSVPEASRLEAWIDRIRRHRGTRRVR